MQISFVFLADGLYASVWTRDISRAGRVAQELEAGHVAVNTASPTGGNQLPLTGWKSSGLGSGDAGLEDVLHWTQSKAVIIDLE
jgi:aldehyde dehydrogenase (NAD+)